MYVAVDEDGKEYAYEYKPKKSLSCWISDDDTPYILMPKGSIASLLGREIKWQEEPVYLDGDYG
jgi:hypothetical protein